MLSDPDTAQILLNLLVPPGAPPFTTPDPASVLQTAKSGRPTIGSVVTGGVLNRQLFTVRVPVLRDGKAKYVLSAVVETPVISKLIERQAFPNAGYCCNR